MWNFIEAFYAQQGPENSGYVTDEFLRGIAEEAKVPDLEQWEEPNATVERWSEVLKGANDEASELGFTGTPSFAIQDGIDITPLPDAVTAADIQAELRRLAACTAASAASYLQVSDERRGPHEWGPERLASLLPVLGARPRGPASLRRDPARRPRDRRALGPHRRGPGGGGPVPALSPRPAAPDDPGGQGRPGRGPLGADGRRHAVGRLLHRRRRPGPGRDAARAPRPPSR